jgi:hypothetical protein
MVRTFVCNKVLVEPHKATVRRGETFRKQLGHVDSALMEGLVPYEMTSEN